MFHKLIEYLGVSRPFGRLLPICKCFRNNRELVPKWMIKLIALYQNQNQMSENKITIENLTKEGLVHMIYKQTELIEKQNDLNKIQEEDTPPEETISKRSHTIQIRPVLRAIFSPYNSGSNTAKSLDTLLHKRSNTIIDTTLSSEVDVQLSIDSPNESLTSHKEKIKSKVIKYKYCILNFIGSVIDTFIMNLLDILPKWLILIISLLLFVTIDLLCYKHTSILLEAYAFFMSLIYSIKSNETQNRDLETASSSSSSSYNSTTHND
ncbi:unnamed protein product [Rotaria socialis]